MSAGSDVQMRLEAAYLRGLKDALEACRKVTNRPQRTTTLDCEDAIKNLIDEATRQ